MDDQLLKHLDGVCEIEKKTIEQENDKAREKVGSPGIRQEWEIDPEKLVIKETFARGAFAYVHRGLYDNQPVAVKVLAWEEEGEKNKAMQSDFQREISVWHKLEYPNITKCIGGTTSKCTCLVTEYLSGGTVKSYLKKFRETKLPMEDVLQLALDVARGLRYLHSKNIVNRDLKTENLLLDEKRIVKIADFGVSCLEASSSSEMTGKTGTLGYMAPEVLECKPYDKKCDVYSFGICLWEIYSVSELTSNVVYKNLRPEIPKNCPSSLANVMKRCWDAEPSKRPEMEEVVTILEGIEAEVINMFQAIDNSRHPYGCFWFSIGWILKRQIAKHVYR